MQMKPVLDYTEANMAARFGFMSPYFYHIPETEINASVAHEFKARLEEVATTAIKNNRRELVLGLGNVIYMDRECYLILRDLQSKSLAQGREVMILDAQDDIKKGLKSEGLGLFFKQFESKV